MEPQNKAGWPYGLLLLPPPPQPATHASLNAAFKDPLFIALTDIYSVSATGVLEAVLPICDLDLTNRAASFATVASLVNGLYALSHSVIIETSTMRVDPRPIDFRVVLLDYDKVASHEPALECKIWQLDVVASIPILVQSERRWDRLYVVESEEGEALYRAFRTSVNAKFGATRFQVLSRNPTRVPGGTILRQNRAANTPEEFVIAAYSTIIALGDFSSLGLSDKVLLTLGVFLLGRRSRAQVENESRRIELSLQDLQENREKRDAVYQSIVLFLNAIGDFRREAPTTTALSSSGTLDQELSGNITLGMRSGLALDVVAEDTIRPVALVAFEQRDAPTGEELDLTSHLALDVFRIPELAFDCPRGQHPAYNL